MSDLDEMYRQAGQGSLPNPSADPTERKVDEFIPEKIRKRERYQKEEGWFDSALGALDYAGNVSRSAILGASRGGLSGALQYGGQALEKKRATSPTQIKDLVFGDLRYGADDNTFQWGDVADFGLDLVADVVTDPITYLSFGFGKLLQGTGKHGAKVKQMSDLVTKDPEVRKVYKSMQTGATSPDDMKRYAKQLGDIGAEEPTKLVGDIFESAFYVPAFQATETAARGTIGALYGAGLTDQDDPLLEKMAKIGGGAAAGAFGMKGGSKLRSKFDRLSDDLQEFYGAGSRGEQTSNLFKTIRDPTTGDITQMGLGPATRIMNSTAIPKINKLIRETETASAEAMKNLDPVEKVSVVTMQTEIKELIKQNRRTAIKGKKKTEEIKLIEEADNKTMESVFETGGLMDQFKSKYTQNAMEALEEMNRVNMDFFNKVNKGDSTVKPIPYYTPTFHKKKMDDADEYMANLKAKKEVDLRTPNANWKTALAKGTGDLEELAQTMIDATPKKDRVPGFEIKKIAEAHEIVYKDYLKKTSHRILDETEKQAKQIHDQYHSLTPTNSAAKNFEKVLGAFDGMSNLMKANMLYASVSWIKNNYWDNMMKGYVETGLYGLLDGSLLKNLTQGVNKDLDAILRGKFADLTPPDKIRLKRAVDSGAIDAGMMSSVMDKELREYMSSSGWMKKQIEADADWKKLGSLEKPVRGAVDGAKAAAKKWENMLAGFTGRAGSYMEGYSRLSTFNRVVDSLEGSGLATSTIDRIASNVVKRTFFNYGELNHLEKAVGKRVFPFYSFYSKNFPYWMDSLFDPTKAGRIGRVEKIRSGIGEDPSPELKMGLTEHLAKNAPRYFGTDKDGDHKIGFLPSMSIHDAIKMIPTGSTTIIDQVVEKSNPYFKAPLEMFFGKDTFTGDPLWVSESARGERYLFSRGYKYYAVKKALEHIGIDEDTLGGAATALVNVRLDKNGNPKSLSDWNIFIDKLAPLVFPTGGLDQIVGSIGKNINDKETLDQTIANLWLPMKTSVMKHDYARLRAGVAKNKIKRKEQNLRKQEQELKRAKKKRERSQ